MDDLEIVKRCARAMKLWVPARGYKTGEFYGEPVNKDAQTFGEWSMVSPPYDPLHDDAHAMALVKKFNLMVNWNSPTEVWCMPMDQAKYGHLSDSPNCADLNRAICECVARLSEEGE